MSVSVLLFFNFEYINVRLMRIPTPLRTSVNYLVQRLRPMRLRDRPKMVRFRLQFISPRRLRRPPRMIKRLKRKVHYNRYIRPTRSTTLNPILHNDYKVLNRRTRHPTRHTTLFVRKGILFSLLIRNMGDRNGMSHPLNFQ